MSDGFNLLDNNNLNDDEKQHEKEDCNMIKLKNICRKLDDYMKQNVKIYFDLIL